MSNSKTLDARLYAKLGTQEKRAINRLLKALAEGSVKKPELSRICRSISRNTACESKKKKSGYIIFYQDRYPHLKKEMPEATLGEIARAAGKLWKDLSPSDMADYNRRAVNSDGDVQ